MLKLYKNQFQINCCKLVEKYWLCEYWLGEYWPVYNWKKISSYVEEKIMYMFLMWQF